MNPILEKWRGMVVFGQYRYKLYNFKPCDLKIQGLQIQFIKFLINFAAKNDRCYYMENNTGKIKDIVHWGWRSWHQYKGLVESD